jgi:hypothetical protein
MTANTILQDKLPNYGEKPARPGMYLGLLHGRDHPQQQMSDWGFNGPMIGPLQWFHTTYACTVRIAFESAIDGLRYFGEAGTDHEIELSGDLLVFGGKYYGDWTVYCVEPEDGTRPADSFRSQPRRQRSGYWAHSPSLS